MESYDGDFSTLFMVFAPRVHLDKPIILTKKHEISTISELENDEFLKRAVEAYFANGGDRLYLLFYEVPRANSFVAHKFREFMIKECDKLNDIELICAINLFDPNIYKSILSMPEILDIQRHINDYCHQTHRISVSDMNEDFETEYLNIIGRTNLYYPWMIDSYEEPLPPSIYAAALFSKMAKENRYFESIANKKLVNVKDVEKILDDDELDQLVVDRINPVIFIPHRGVRIWGVKSFNESLDSVNELRVMKYIKRRLIKMSRVYLFEPNSIFLEAQLILLVKSFFENLETIGAVSYHNVERDDDSLLIGNEIIINIQVSFYTPVEYINIRLNKSDGKLSLT
jgi:hypothetical protein